MDHNGRAASKVVIILVHGLFIGPWAWRYVSKRLSAEFPVLAPRLPFKSLEEDAALVRQRVVASQSDGKRVLLVGHSYGGMVISRAGHDASHLVYLAALAPQPGDCTFDLANRHVSAACQDAMIPSPDGTAVSIDSRKAVEPWYHLCNPIDTRFAMQRHRSAPASIFAERVDNPAWLERPSSYIICDEDRALDPDYQRDCGLKMTTSTLLHADHSPFLSATEALSATIAGLARSLQ